MTERQDNKSSLSDLELRNKAESFDPKNIVLKTKFDVPLLVETSAYAQRSNQQAVDDLVDKARLISEIRSEVGFISANKNVISKKESDKFMGMLGFTNDVVLPHEKQIVEDKLDSLAQDQDEKKKSVWGRLKRSWQDFKDDYLPSTPKKVASLLVAAFTSFQLGMSSVKAETAGDVKPDKKIESEGEIDQVDTLNGVQMVDNVDAVSGAAPAVTDAEKASLRRAILKATPTPTPTAEPLPTDRIAEAMKQYKEQRIAKYIQEIKDYGCTETDLEVLDLYANTLNIFDSVAFYKKNGDKVYESMLGSTTREQLLDYFVTKEGMDFYREDGVDQFLILNGDKKLDGALAKTIEWYKKNGVENIVDYLRSNGVYAFSFYYFGDKYGFKGNSIGASALYKEGVTIFNIDAKQVKKFSLKEPNLVNNFRRNVVVESIGIAQMNFIYSINLENQVGTENMEMVKSFLAAYNYEFLYKKTGNKDYKNLIESMYGSTDQFSVMYGIPIDDPQVLSQKSVIMSGNFAKAAGSEDWSFYKATA